MNSPLAWNGIEYLWILRMFSCIWKWTEIDGIFALQNEVKRIIIFECEQIGWRKYSCYGVHLFNLHSDDCFSHESHYLCDYIIFIGFSCALLNIIAIIITENSFNHWRLSVGFFCMCVWYVCFSSIEFSVYCIHWDKNTWAFRLDANTNLCL